MCFITAMTNVHLVYNVKPTEYTIHTYLEKYNMQIWDYFFFRRLEKYDIDISTFRKEIEKNHIKCFVSYNLLSHFSLTI